MSAPAILRVEQLKVHFRQANNPGMVQAVDGIDLQVAPGEFHGIVGESGCGKTTLARTLVGLQIPTSGRVLIGDRELGDWRKQDLKGFAREVQFVFQNPLASLSHRQTIYQCLEEPLLIHKIGSSGSRREKILGLLDLVGLPQTCLDRLPRALSGGQRQRVAIARALALDPKILICDEPLSALDVSVRAQILNLFASLQQRLGLTIFLIAHDLAVVREVCSRVSVMYLGRIVESGDTGPIFDAPSHPYTKALLSAVPAPDPRIERHRKAQLLVGDPPSPSAPPSGCRFHPRCPEARPSCSIKDQVLARVDRHRFAACELSSAGL